jgi:hypothetical protein
MRQRGLPPSVRGVAAYVAECYWLGVTRAKLAAAVAQAEAAARELSRHGDPVRVTGSLLIPADETAFLFIDARSIDGARALGERASVPFERVVEATHVQAGGRP